MSIFYHNFSEDIGWLKMGRYMEKHYGSIYKIFLNGTALHSLCLVILWKIGLEFV